MINVIRNQGTAMQDINKDINNQIKDKDFSTIVGVLITKGQNFNIVSNGLAYPNKHDAVIIVDSMLYDLLKEGTFELTLSLRKK